MTLINIFLFYSILGNLFEKVIMFFINKNYISGFMNTIFTPIYGIAALIILYIHKKIKIKNKLLKILIETIIYAITLSILEFLGGILIENIFNKIYWNYDKFKFNIGKYISLETSLVWGILSIITIYIIQPLYKKIENKIPKPLTISLSIFFIINLIIILIVK